MWERWWRIRLNLNPFLLNLLVLYGPTCFNQKFSSVSNKQLLPYDVLDILLKTPFQYYILILVKPQYWKSYGDSYQGISRAILTWKVRNYNCQYHSLLCILYSELNFYPVDDYICIIGRDKLEEKKMSCKSENFTVLKVVPIGPNNRKHTIMIIPLPNNWGRGESNKQSNVTFFFFNFLNSTIKLINWYNKSSPG